jgi:dTDP-4-dehydrorhamnose 3,5-epimerase-like enzyme
LVDSVQKNVTTQDYSKKPEIEGVKLVTLKNHIVEDGDFSELFRISSGGVVQADEFPNFHIEQINRTKVFSGTIKAWHLHFRQDEIWYAAPSAHLVVGLWDVRKKSATSGNNMKVILGGGESRLLYIPKGVAHGCTNRGKKPVDIYYFINSKFDKDSPDEKRIPWDSLGSDFWTPERG